MKITLVFVFILLTLTLKAQVYKNPKAPVKSRVADLVLRMTLDEKISYINGTNWIGDDQEGYFGFDAGNFELLIGQSSSTIKLKKVVSFK